MGDTLTLCSERGWADICNIAAFYLEKAPMFTLSVQQDIAHQHIRQVHSVCMSQACVASCKWTSGSVLTFQEKDSKFHVMNFTGKPSPVES